MENNSNGSRRDIIIDDEFVANLYEKNGAQVTDTEGERIIAPNGEEYILKREEYRIVLPEGDLKEFWKNMNK